MIPGSFEYHRPATLAEALALLAEFGDDAKLLAGGHSLVPSMKLRMIQPAHLIDLGSVEELKGISATTEHLRVGAMTTHWQVESSRIVRSVLPVLSEVASVIADPQVRNRGTMGGSVSNADPAADYPASLLMLDAELVCLGPQGERRIKAADWFVDLFTTALEDNEILREIRFPLLPQRTAAIYLKHPHPASRFAVVGVAVALTVDTEFVCRNVRIAITGAGTHAVRTRAVEDALLGAKLDEKAIASASQWACEGLPITGDFHFSAEDRQDLCRVFVRRGLTEAFGRASSGAFQNTADTPKAG